MTDFLDSAARFWNDFSVWNPPELVTFIVFGFGILAAWILSRRIAAPPLFSGPISFMILVFAGLMSNFSSRGIAMMGTSDIQRVMVFTVIGHVIASIIILGLFRVSSMQRRAR
jgi:hypothetical protein